MGLARFRMSRVVTAVVLALAGTAALSASPASADTAGTTYLHGRVYACTVILSTGECDPNNWWVNDDYYVTTDGTHLWNNSHTCTSHGTPVTWCGDSNNGTTLMQEGFNFGNDGWARVDLNGDGTLHAVRGSTYAWVVADPLTVVI